MKYFNMELVTCSINHSGLIRIKSGTHGIDSVLSFKFHHWIPDQVFNICLINFLGFMLIYRPDLGWNKTWLSSVVEKDPTLIF